jgi:hypothetical protein
MAKKKAQRTTLRSSKGTKLYAVRKADGTFKDIQTYKRAHGQDIKRHSAPEEAKRHAAEMAVHEGIKVEPAPGVTLPGMPIPIPTPGSSHGSPITSPMGSVAHNAKAGTTKSGASSKKPEPKKAVKPMPKKAALKKPTPVKKAAPKKAAKKAAPVKKAKKK